MSERSLDPRDVGDGDFGYSDIGHGVFGDKDFGDTDLFDALARAGLPTPPSLDPDRRAMIAAELARLDLTLAPARARSAALRRLGGWSALIVMAIVLMWALDMRRDGSNVLDGDPGAVLDSGAGSDLVESAERDPFSQDGAETDDPLATAGDSSERDGRSAEREKGTSAEVSGGVGADVDETSVVTSESSGRQVSPRAGAGGTSPGSAGAVTGTSPRSTDGASGVSPGSRAGSGGVSSGSAGGKEEELPGSSGGAVGAPTPVGSSREGVSGSRPVCAFESAADRIFGRVVDGGGAPLADMTLLVYEVNASTARYFGASDDNGCFALSGVRSGRYRIEVESTLDAGRNDGPSAGALATAYLTLDGVRPAVPLYLRVQ